VEILTMEAYKALPHEERTLLRRAAYGMRDIPPELVAGFDLAALRDMLDAENQRTGTFAERWSDQGEDDEALEAFR
jgi:hypothetical protein